ncbi:MAG: HAD hydrolase-like protein [Oscillospiraceae bacterium]|nr:HAD hydrolase-like protein [Oscillospiraceae bacterium]
MELEQDFVPTKRYLLCIDSDGCAMDTMTSKHMQAFCPALITVFQLEKYEKIITEQWMNINLYSQTRGMNRFKGLEQILQFAQENGAMIPELTDLKQWIRETPGVSGETLHNQQQQGKYQSLHRVMLWNNTVNQKIAKMGPAEAYTGVKEALQEAYGYANIVVVSSANKKAVIEEWKHCGLAAYVSQIMGQENGSKAECISNLLKRGYVPNRVLMIGDALSDLAAAKANDVKFYPILVKKEEESWRQFAKDSLPKFISDTFDAKYQAEIILQQKNNLTI